ncbi:hypothetical protein ACH5BF_00915 [Arcobacter sp. YIC-464]|uniref:hypothetical protein n=1 Tax=Arcobacter sp. YIC-464 TaxID=3376631 RepID=UPI003C141C08
MKIVTFCELDESLFGAEHTVEHFHSGSSGEADVVVLDINSIFEFEENKAKVCAKKYVSIAVVEDDSDYDAFKNFGIDAWIKADDISQIKNLINLVQKRFLS